MSRAAAAAQLLLQAQLMLRLVPAQAVAITSVLRPHPQRLVC
jgi:hypothetical protein